MKTSAHLPSAEILRKAATIASYYGFVPLEEVLGKRLSTAQKELSLVEQRTLRGSDGFSDEAALLVRHCISCNAAPKTRAVLVYHTTALAPARTEGRMMRFGLSVLGNRSSIAEALVLKTALDILRDIGEENPRLIVGSMGDKDSSARFLREITAYLRKNLDDLPSPARTLLKKDPFAALFYLKEKRHPVGDASPRPIEFLTESSRRHLRDVLEFLETAGVSYELSPDLMGNRDSYSQTIFEIHSEHTPDGAPALRIRGGRYDELGRRHFRVPIPAVGILFEGTWRGPLRAKIAPKTPKAKIFFIHVGDAAKRQSFSVLELLRRAHIPVHQSLAEDKLGGQLDRANELRIPYTIIMGQREALDGTVIVRNMATHAQNTLPVSDLASYLKSALV